MLDTVLSFVAPHSCCSCGELGRLLCEMCKNDITHERFEQCIGCFKPSTKGMCRGCSRKMRADMAWCVGVREGVLLRLLDNYKFRSAKESAQHIADLLDSTLPLLTDIVVVPVPTARQHVRVRGFDHTELFAKQFAKMRALPLSQPLENLSNDIQHFKSRTERLRAAEHALQIKNPAPKCVLLIDDIMTTGATLSVCAKRLREAGAEEVYIAVVTRQVLDR